MKVNFIKKIFCGLVFFVVFAIGILTISNENEYSVYEARALTKFPKFNITNFFNDNIYQVYTDAFSDQLIGKNILVKLFFLVNPHKYFGDIALGKDGQLYPNPLVVEDDTEYVKSLENVISRDINTVADNINELGASFIFVAIPRKDIVMKEYLPKSYLDGTKSYLKYIDIIKNKKNDNVYLIDSYELFNEDTNINPFYKTDHHLNIRGGYAIFEEIISFVNVKHNVNIDLLENEYIIKKVKVNGSYNRKTGEAIVPVLEEHNLVPRNNKLRYTRYDNGQKSLIPIFGNDITYASAYMGTDYGETVVKTNLKDAPNILYVGTSYTNVLESLSCYKFNTMVSIDYRHNNTGKSIEDYVKEYDIDYVVFIPAEPYDPFRIDAITQQLGL